MSLFTRLVSTPGAAPLAVLGICAVLLAPIFAGGWPRKAMAEEGISLPAPAVSRPAPAGTTETAVVAGGCFWGVQGVYQHVKGVQRVLSGYSGGEATTAEYERVGTGRTGHAESVEIVFDPKQISYGEILHIFFSVAHDPTQLNKQGPDWGTQYRSAIFYANADQQKVAEAYIAQLNDAKAFKKQIVTRVDPLKAFYPAEGYHQDYLLLHPYEPYIVYNDLPKIEHLKRLFTDRFTSSPVTVASTKAK